MAIMTVSGRVALKHFFGKYSRLIVVVPRFAMTESLCLPKLNATPSIITSAVMTNVGILLSDFFNIKHSIANYKKLLEHM